jgi:endo-1,4-beta-xylanase
MWGITDAHSWRAASEPLLFDSGYEPKPAYKALLKELAAR